MRKFIIEIDDKINTNPEAIRASIGLLGTNGCIGLNCRENCEMCPYIEVKEVEGVI